MRAGSAFYFWLFGKGVVAAASLGARRLVVSVPCTGNLTFVSWVKREARDYFVLLIPSWYTCLGTMSRWQVLAPSWYPKLVCRLEDQWKTQDTKYIFMLCAFNICSFPLTA